MNMLKMNTEKIDEEFLDYTLVPAGLVLLLIYNIWLLFTIHRHPSRTVIGLNRVSRHQWVLHMMSDPKNGILAIQTLRNNLMASTLLATISITLSSLISAVVSSASDTLALTYTIHTVKYFSILLCFLTAFFCSMQCIRYFAHVSFLINVPSSSEGKDTFVNFVSHKLNRGCLFWSLALRAFYFAFPLLLWIFGPVTMFVCSCFMVALLYFLDIADSVTEKLQNNGHVEKYSKDLDVEARGDSREGGAIGDSNMYSSLLV